MMISKFSLTQRMYEKIWIWALHNLKRKMMELDYDTQYIRSFQTVRQKDWHPFPNPIETVDGLLKRAIEKFKLQFKHDPLQNEKVMFPERHK